jgi:phosphopantothenoylcysteine decarboxylase/phosphopantothenate--cysteine ligase
MHCIVTAGATWEPLDRVRRLTNFSTGSLGTSLARRLAEAGHAVDLFLAESIAWETSVPGISPHRFTTTATLEALFHGHRSPAPLAIFHAAAVSDFQSAGCFERTPDGSLIPLAAGKLSTRDGTLWVELRPTPKILPQLRDWFPAARITGWKYETDGTRADVLARAARQFAESRTDACVANGPAYGDGFGLVMPSGTLQHLPDRPALFDALVAAVEYTGCSPSSPSSPSQSGL